MSMTEASGAGGLSAPRLPVPGKTPPEDISIKTKIRAAVAADLPACAAIINDYIDATDWLPRVQPAAAIRAMFGPELLERRQVLVADQGGAVVGYLSLAPDGVVPGFYLAPAARGRGIGQALLAAAKRLAPAGLELTVFEPNLVARRFYAAAGFHEMPGRRVEATEEGVPTLRLRWEGAA